MEETIEEVNQLARSVTRIRLFEAVYERGPLEKDALKDVVDVSRTTVQRNLEVLQERGWIQGDNREYWITQAGEQVAEQFLELLETVYVARQFQPFLEWVPADVFDLELQTLASSDIVVGTEANPYAPVNRHVDRMQTAERFRCLLPAVGLQPLLVARECVLEHGHRHETIIDADVAETLVTDRTYQQPIEELLASDRCDILVASEPVPFYLGLTEDIVQVGVGDDDGVPQSLVESENDPVVEWAQQTYTEYRNEAEPLGTRITSPKTA